jgi:hypothetical protein
MILDTDERHEIVGEIYKITNTVTNKCYIGQTRSHRLNHGKYRPYGYLGRFKSHISGSRSNQDHCKYLNSSIRKYGEDSFKTELIFTCKIDELDEYEKHYIIEYKSKYPNGYNLTNGGQGKGYQKGDKIVFHEPNPVPPNHEKKSLKKSEETKKLISERLKAIKRDEDHRKMMTRHTQNQHYNKKFDIFKNVTVDESKIEKYIRIRHNHPLNYDFVRVIINKKGVNFIGKTENIEDLKEKARTFIRELISRQRDQTAGTPTNDIVPFHNGNIMEEHG